MICEISWHRNRGEGGRERERGGREREREGWREREKDYGVQIVVLHQAWP